MRYRVGSLLLLFLVAAAPHSAATGAARLVADLDPRLASGASVPPLGADPSGWTAFGRRALFVAHGAAGEREPWVTDGTPLGTFQLADTCAGQAACGSGPTILGAGREVAFFLDAQRRLWRTDGTVGGTFVLLEQVAAPLHHVVAADGLYFAHGDAARGREPWRSDGSLAGTGPILDLAPGSAGSEPSGFHLADRRVVFNRAGGGVWSTNGSTEGTFELFPGGAVTQGAAHDSRAYLVVFTPADGEELYVTNGTVTGTRRLTSSTTPGSTFSPSTLLPRPGGGLVFTANDGLNGREVFVTDGRRPAVRASATPDGPLSVAAVGRGVAFTAYDTTGEVRLWAGDGSALAQPLASGCPQGCPEVSFHTILTSAGSFAFFSGRDGRGLEPWSTDGTAAGTRRLADVCRGPCDGHVAAAQGQIGRLLFAAGPLFADDVELWSTDGTAAGTRAISRFVDPDPFREGDQPHQLQGVSSDGAFYFGAADPLWGLQPWVTDGTLATTRLVTVVAPNGQGSRPADLGALGGGAAFVACDGANARGYRVTDNEELAVLLDPQPAVACADGFFSSGLVSLARPDRAYLLQASFDDPALWVVAAAGGTPTRLVTFDLGTLSGVSRLFPWGEQGVAFFTSDPATFAPELWVSDGTAAGTLAIDLPAGLTHPTELYTVGSRLFFSAHEPAPHGRSLWTSDGSAAGTSRLAAEAGSVSDAAALGGSAYLLVDGSLWHSDGTPGGTSRRWPDEGTPGTASALEVMSGSLYLTAGVEPGSVARQGLWRSDGTAAGTSLVFELPVPPFGRNEPGGLVAAGTRLFFSSSDPQHGREPWQSDGTAAGTALLRDIAPGVASSFPRAFTPTPGGTLHFVASDPRHGSELWSSDGSAAGTHLVQDIGPGALSGEPDQLTVSGTRLFFVADDGLHGREPWVLPLTGEGDCVPADQRLCLAGSRFAVEVRWRAHDGTTGVAHARSLTADTGAFWFFSPGNLELMVKVIDGSPVNEHRWVFYAALSDVEYSLTVTDTATGAVRRYFNPAGVQASVGDTEAFGPRGATAAATASGAAVARAGQPPARHGAPSAAESPCAPGPDRLCFADGRFTATVQWDTGAASGGGVALPLTADSGVFWFFGADNLELMVRLLDGRQLNGAWWVYFGALSNVAYTLTITDATSGRVVEYRNPVGRFASVGDPGAFPD